MGALSFREPATECSVGTGWEGRGAGAQGSGLDWGLCWAASLEGLPSSPLAPRVRSWQRNTKVGHEGREPRGRWPRALVALACPGLRSGEVWEPGKHFEMDLNEGRLSDPRAGTKPPGDRRSAFRGGVSSAAADPAPREPQPLASTSPSAPGRAQRAPEPRHSLTRKPEVLSSRQRTRQVKQRLRKAANSVGPAAPSWALSSLPRTASSPAHEDREPRKQKRSVSQVVHQWRHRHVAHAVVAQPLAGSAPAPARPGPARGQRCDKCAPQGHAHGSAGSAWRFPNGAGVHTGRSAHGSHRAGS